MFDIPIPDITELVNSTASREVALVMLGGSSVAALLLGWITLVRPWRDGMKERKKTEAELLTLAAEDIAGAISFGITDGRYDAQSVWRVLVPKLDGIPVLRSKMLVMLGNHLSQHPSNPPEEVVKPTEEVKKVVSKLQLLKNVTPQTA
jgi:hypothetical protein